MCLLDVLTEPANVVATTTTLAFEPLSMWVPSNGVDGFDIVMNVSHLQGDIELKPGVQTAEVRPDKPDDPAALSVGAYVQAEGHTHYREPVSLPNKGYVRIGLMYRIKSGGTGQGSAQVTLTVIARRKGGPVDMRTVLIQFDTNTADITFLAISDFQPLLGVSSVKALFVVTGLNDPSYLEYRLAARSANDRASPNPWQLMEAGWTGPGSSNTERNTGEVSLPAGLNASTHQRFQLAVAVRKKSGAGGAPRGECFCATFVTES